MESAESALQPEPISVRGDEHSQPAVRAFGDLYDLAVIWSCDLGIGYLVDTGKGPGPCTQLTYDGIPEVCGTNVFTGKNVVITETETDNEDGTVSIIIEAASEDGSDLLPAGFTCGAREVAGPNHKIDTLGADLAKRDAGGLGTPGDALDPTLGVSPFDILEAVAAVVGESNCRLLAFDLNSAGTAHTELKDRFTVGGVDQVAVTALQFRYRIAVSELKGACCLPDDSCTPSAAGEAAVTASQCAMLGGDYLGDLSVCPGTTCTPPFNDTCAKAVTVTDGVTTFDTRGSTLDPAAPKPCDPDLINGVWFKYTATCDGLLTVDTCGNTVRDGAGPDTVVEVLSGSDCATATTEACADDTLGCGQCNKGSAASLSTTSGTLYLIKVGGSGGVGVTGNLSIVCESAITGACCNPTTGGCGEANSAEDCANQGGSYRGDGTRCADGLCTGACCLGDANCVQVTLDHCQTTLGGLWQGLDSECGAFCPRFGACCETSGGCVDGVDQFSCDGVYQGDATQCANVTCGGACCNPTTGGCGEANSAEDCTNQGGSYRGDGTDCADNLCTGACCLGDANCLQATLTACQQGIGGRWQGLDSECGAFCPRFGACCQTSGGCVDGVDPFSCDGAYQGDATRCADLNCGGACCTSATACTDVQGKADCDSLGGAYQGDGTTCGAFIDIEALSTALHVDTCDSDYDTQLSILDACGGDLLATNDDCADTSGGSGADPTSDCFDADPAATENGSCTCVSSAAGEHFFVQVTRSGGGPPPPGSNTSLFIVHGGACSPLPSGACCSDGLCGEGIRPGFCEDVGGVYQGDDSTCADVTCPEPIGACCYDDGGCLDPMHDSDCVVGGGAFHKDQTCADVACRQPTSPTDLWVTCDDNQPETVTFQDFSNTPLPADFFDPGSDPFDGRVEFKGTIIDAAQFGETDTMINRTADPVSPEDEVGTEGTAHIQIRSLHLQSQRPIVVTYNNGNANEEWTVTITLSDAPQPVGTLTATKTFDNGGTFDTILPVRPRFTFERVDDGTLRVLDFGEEGLPSVVFESADSPFVHTVDPSVEIVTSEGTNFVPGVTQTDPNDLSTQAPGEVIEREALAQHGVCPPRPIPPPPDCMTTCRDGSPGPTFIDLDLAAGALGDGCEAFAGRVPLAGVPLDPATTGDAAACLQRSADPVRPDDPTDTVGQAEIALVALNLHSVDPFPVTCNGDDTEWHLRVTTSPTKTPSAGAVTATKSHGNGGTSDVTVRLLPLFTFERASGCARGDTNDDGIVDLDDHQRFSECFTGPGRVPPNDCTCADNDGDGDVDIIDWERIQSRFGEQVGAPQVVTFDTGDTGEPAIELVAPGVPFVHTVDPGLAFLVPEGAAYVSGIEETVPGDTTSQTPQASTYDGTVTRLTLCPPACVVDLDIDSDNSSAEPDFPPDRSDREDLIEDDDTKPGRYVCVNDDDDDGDGVPDPDDGFDQDGTPGNADDENASEDDFVRVVLEIPPPIDLDVARIRFLRSGSFRFWHKNGNQPRRFDSVSAGGDRVPSGIYAPSDLGLSNANRTTNLWVEGMGVSQLTISDLLVVEVDPDGEEGPADFVCKDQVRLRIINIEFIDDTNNAIPKAGQQAHLDISNEKTDESLPDTATFDGPPTTDLDNFRVEVTGLLAGMAPQIRLVVTGSDGETYTHTFTTVEGPGPAYRLDGHVRLVSNDVDDAHLAHQTPQVQIGDIVRAALVSGGRARCTTRLPVCRPFEENHHHAIRTCRNHFVEVNIPGTMVTANSDVPVTTTRMSRAWGQCCVRFTSTTRERNPVANVLSVAGVASAAGNVSITVDGQPVGPIAIANGQSTIQVAQAIAAAINTAVGAGTASAFNSFPGSNLAHVISKIGQDVLYMITAQNVSGVAITVPALDFTDGIGAAHEEPALDANYGDADPDTIDFFIIDTLESGNRGDAWPACNASIGNTSDLRNSSYIVLSTGDTAPDNPFTTAHEAGRFILNYCGLHPDPLNLQATTPVMDSIGAAKRLEDAQCTTARIVSEGMLLRQE